MDLPFGEEEKYEEPKLERSIQVIEPLWSEDILDQLKAIEANSSKMSELNRVHYLSLVEMSKWFRLPIICFSSLNSIFAVGMNRYMSQENTSLITCLISFLVGLISSIELYLGLIKRLELSLTSYKAFYLLSIKIQHVLRIEKIKKDDPIAFLTEVLTEYEELFKQSAVYEDKYNDYLITMDFKTSSPLGMKKITS